MKNIGAFTLVELIVVVTILAILGTIGFVSYSSYLTSVRDANRTATLQNISDGLVAYSTKASLPLPDQASLVQSGSTTIVHHGQAGVTVLETIDYSKSGEDPTDNVPFGYVVDNARKYFQLVAFAEEPDTSIGYNILFNKVQAIDYSLRYPIFYGDKIGVFLDTTTLEPRDLSDGSPWDISSSIAGYELYYSSDNSITTVDIDAYVNTVQIGGLVSSCAVLNAKKRLTATGSYYTATGTIAEPNDCGPNS